MGYVTRLVDHRLDQVLATFPAAMILGPRASGKTTTARRRAAVVIELDDPPQAAAFRADPTAALAAAMGRAARSPQGCVLLDEWQDVPDVLGAVKRLVDHGAPPGSFLLTGSVRPALASTSWAGTGRVIHVDMFPMTVQEQARSISAGVVDALLDGRASELPLPDDAPDIVGYVETLVRGGYPPVVGLNAAMRATWMDSYTEQIVLRDVPELGRTRDGVSLRRLVRAIAENTAGITADSEIAAAVGVDVRTVRRNEGFLDDLRIVTTLPAWHSNRISRLVKSRKRYVVDTGLAASVLGVDATAVLADGGLLGRLLDTFVLAQLRPMLAVGAGSVGVHHLRQQDGRHEVDLVLERADGRICGIEVKAGAAPTPSDGRHLAWLRDELGDRFVAGVVMHTGRSSFAIGERIVACPIAALWGTTAAATDTRS